MSNLSLKQIHNVIINKQNDSNSVDVSWKQIKIFLKKLQDDRVEELTVNYIHKDDWPDDEELQDIEEDINIVENIIKKTNN